MKMLSTLLEPTEGTARILGFDVVHEARDVRRRMGAVLSDGRSLYWKLTARENLEYFAALYHVPPKEQAARIASALAVKLDDRSDDYVERYSTGMRQRLVLARALLPDPELLLDEPTVGLDPQSSRDLRDRVRDLQAQGRTVLLTTHYMEEADQPATGSRSSTTATWSPSTPGRAEAHDRRHRGRAPGDRVQPGRRRPARAA